MPMGGLPWNAERSTAPIRRRARVGRQYNSRDAFRFDSDRETFQP